MAKAKLPWWWWFNRKAAGRAMVKAMASEYLEKGDRYRDDHPPAPGGPPVRVDDEGVFVQLGSRGTEGVRWPDLAEVSIRTTAAGPWGEDVFWVLSDGVGGGCVVPSSAEVAVRELMERLGGLPGFDHGKVIDAMGSTDDAVFVCWRRPP